MKRAVALVALLALGCARQEAAENFPSAVILADAAEPGERLIWSGRWHSTATRSDSKK